MFFPFIAHFLSPPFISRLMSVAAPPNSHQQQFQYTSHHTSTQSSPPLSLVDRINAYEWKPQPLPQVKYHINFQNSLSI